MKLITLSILFMALTACSASSTKTPEAMTDTQKKVVTPAQAVKSCICVKMWMPVCGVNNKTYGNSCEADCALVKYTQGACEAKE